MTDYSQFQFKDNMYSRPSNMNNNLDEKDEWEDNLHNVVNELMPYSKYKRIMIFSAFMTTYFFIIAIVIHVLSNGIFERIFDYQSSCKARGQPCKLNFTLPHLEPPIHLYYEIHHILQNQRDMLNSIDYQQLNGQLTPNPTCGSRVTNRQMNKNTSLSGKPLPPDDIAIPCGLMAYTFFNDSFKIHYYNDTRLSEIKFRTSDLTEFEHDFKNTEDYQDK